MEQSQAIQTMRELIKNHSGFTLEEMGEMSFPGKKILITATEDGSVWLEPVGQNSNKRKTQLKSPANSGAKPDGRN